MIFGRSASKAIAFATLLLALLNRTRTEAGSLAVREAAPMRPTCSLADGKLIAQFPQGTNISVTTSAVFDVRDRSNRILLTEIVPIATTGPTIGVIATPLDKDGVLNHASTVTCFLNKGYGNDDMRAGRCPQSAAVDSGVGVRPLQFELAGRRIFVRAALSHAMLGATVIGSFRNEKFYLSQRGGGTSNVVSVNGLDPQIITISSQLTHDNSTVFMSADGDFGDSLLTICVARR